MRAVLVVSAPAGRAQMAPSEGGKTEKITINLGLVDLGQIDLLVQEGFYTNRTDFIRTSIGTEGATCFFFQAEDGIRDRRVTGVQKCAPSDLDVDHLPGVADLL